MLLQQSLITTVALILPKSVLPSALWGGWGRQPQVTSWLHCKHFFVRLWGWESGVSMIVWDLLQLSGSGDWWCVSCFWCRTRSCPWRWSCTSGSVVACPGPGGGSYSDPTTHLRENKMVQDADEDIDQDLFSFERNMSGWNIGKSVNTMDSIQSPVLPLPENKGLLICLWQF